MMLSDADIQILQRDGFLIMPDLFSVEEIEALNDRLQILKDETCPENILEKNSNEVRMVMAVHQRDKLFEKFVHDPRIVEPLQQIRQEPIYIQQTKVNSKAPLTNDVWQWHYDFGNHHIKDGVPEPLALSFHVFLDDIGPFNGPIHLIPGSHRSGTDGYAQHPVYYDDYTTSYAVWAVDDQVISAQVKKAGQINPDQQIVAATGRKGTALLFYDTTLHCSPANVSPWKRTIFSLIANPVRNAYTNTERPDYLHHKDLTPL